MTSLRERMVEELCRHNYAMRTRKNYVSQIVKLARHFGTSPDQLTREQVAEYQDLITEQGVSWLPQAVAALQFFYNKVLQRDWKIEQSRRPRSRRSAAVFTPEEVSRLLAAAEPGKPRMLFTTMYGCGLRLSEGIGLQVKDIDSQRNVIHIRKGKGRKDRYVPLGENLLEQLREYWRAEKPTSFLFPGSTIDKPWHANAIRQEFRIAQRIAGIARQCTIHTLRHSYASHCLQAGVKVGTIQQILGHANLETTATYTHVIGGITGTGETFPDLLAEDPYAVTGCQRQES